MSFRWGLVSSQINHTHGSQMIIILIFNMTAQYLHGRDSSIFEFMSTRQMQIACNPIAFPCSRYLFVNTCF